MGAFGVIAVAAVVVTPFIYLMQVTKNFIEWRAGARKHHEPI